MKVSPTERLGYFSLAVLIFPLCCHTSTDVALSFVDIKNLPYLYVQPVVICRQPLGQILVYSGFGDSEVLCRCSYSSACVNHIRSQTAGSFLYGVCHNLPSNTMCYPENTMLLGNEICVLDSRGFRL